MQFIFNNYHMNTKHTYLSIRTNPNRVNWNNPPNKFKFYSQEYKRVQLTSQSENYNFLYLIAGISAKKTYPDTEYYLRINPSAGALYPNEIYFQVRNVDGFEDGIYHFEVGSSSVVLLKELKKDEGIEQLLEVSYLVDGFIFFISSIYFRSSWKYKNRAFRYCLLDAGHIIGSMEASSYLNDVKTWPLNEIDDYSQDTSSNTTLPTMTDLEDVFQMVLNMVGGKGGVTYQTHIQMELNYYKTKIQEAKSENVKAKYEKLLKQREEEVADYKKTEDDEDLQDLVWFSKYNIDFSKYSNRNVVSTLNTIGVYIRTFSNMNIFNAKKPKFNKNINRLDLSGFTNAGKPEFALFFFDLFLQRVFGKCKLKGEYKDRPAEQRTRGAKCDVFVVIDESRVVLPTGRDKDNPYHMLNKITAESRKYGLGLILGSQRITHYSDDILANIYTKILLQTDPSDIPTTNKKLKIQNKDLLELTKYNDVGVIGMGGIYKAVHMDLFEQYKKQ